MANIVQHYANVVEGSLSNSATRYLQPFGKMTPESLEIDGLEVIGSACTVSRMRIELDTAPGAGTSWTFTIRKNGSDTALAVTISNTDTTGEDTSNSITFAAGDYISISCVPSGTPTVPGKAQRAIKLENTVDGTCQAFFVNVVGAFQDTQFLPGISYDGASQDSADETGRARALAGVDGTVKAAYFQMTPGSTPSYDFQLRKNGVDIPGAVVSISAADSGNFTGRSDTFSEGDYLSWSISLTGTSSGGAWTLVYEASAPSFGGQETGILSSGQFLPWGQGEELELTGTSEADAQATFNEVVTINGMTVRNDNSVSGGSWTFEIFDDGTATGVQVVISSGATGTTSATYVTSIGSKLSLKYTSTASNNPADTHWYFGGASLEASLAVTRADMTEDEVREIAGDQTIVLTLTNATWDADVGSNASETEDLICGLDSAQSEVFGWNNIVRGGECYSAAVLADSPAGYWRLGDASGDAADLSGNGNDGTYEGTQETGVGLVKNSAQLSTKFNDVLTKVMVPDTASAIDGIFDSGGTAEALIRPWSDGGGDQGRIFAKNDTNGGWEFTVYEQANGYVRLQFRHDFSTTDGVWVTAVAVPLSTANHVAVVYDNSSVNNDPTIYINGGEYTIGNGGLLEITTPSGTRVSDASSDFYIGNTASVQGALHFRGEIQEAALYTSELSKTRILEHLKAASNPFGLSHADVVRTSDTVVTITLPDFPLYDISVTETITVTAVASTHSGSSDLTGTPTFDVTPTDYVSPYNPGSGDPGGGGPGGTDNPGGSEDNPPDGSTGGGGPGDGTGGGAGGDDDFGGFNGGLGSQSPQANRTLGDGDTYSFGLAGLGVGLDPGGRIRVIRIDAAEISESS